MKDSPVVTTREVHDGVVITLSCHMGSPCASCREDIRGEALLWLRELSDTFGSAAGRTFSMLSSSVGALHQCQPPQAYLGQGESEAWSCPDCGTAWRLRVLAEGRSFGTNGGPYVWGEWVPERRPALRRSSE